MSKHDSMMNFNVDTPPSMVPRAEKSTVRSDMNKALETMRARRANQALRRESGSAVTEAEMKMAAPAGYKRAPSGILAPLPGAPADKALRMETGAAVTPDEAMAAKKAKRVKRFDDAMQHPALKGLGL
jgi:hypothetical protein